MKSAAAPLRLTLLCLLLLTQTGCAWWRHRHAAADQTVAVAPAAASDAATGKPANEPSGEPEAVTPPVLLTEAQQKSAIALAADFYEMHMRMSARGLPDPGSMNAYAAFLCPTLSTAITDARTRQQQFIRAHPQEKPPLVEGDLFSSLFEGAERAVALEAIADVAGARVTMSLSRGKGTEVQRWKDDLLLGRDDQVWCVADVEYRGDWAFANHGRLGDSLKAQ